MKSGSATNGVETGAPQSGADAGGRIGSDLPSAGRYGCSMPEPPAGLAGFVHAASSPAPLDLPKSEFDGGGAVERNEPYVIAQPVCFLLRQSGMFLKSPPTSAPVGTWRLVPRR